MSSSENLNITRIEHLGGEIVVLDRYVHSDLGWIDDVVEVANNQGCAAVVCFGRANWVKRQVEWIVTRNFLEFHSVPDFSNALSTERNHRIWETTLAATGHLLANGAKILFVLKDHSWLHLPETLAALGVKDDVLPSLLHLPGVTSEFGTWEGPQPEHAPLATSRDCVAIRDRAIGALLGLAIGDAVGATHEFSPKPDKRIAWDMVGGGPFDLRPGEWTDDTAMAFALATSLLANAELDQADLADRFVEWWKSGTYSCTGTCFDIGTTTRGSLERYLRTRNPVAGPEEPESAGNGALMRLAPVAIRHWNDSDKAALVADRQTVVTHAAPAARKASQAFARLLTAAIAGAPAPDVLASEHALAFPEWRGASRQRIRGSGYVVHSFEASLWAVSRTSSFESAVLLAVNLGEDADTTGAITGQLAGALYGASSIPAKWLSKLSLKHELSSLAESLFEASNSETQALPGRII